MTNFGYDFQKATRLCKEKIVWRSLGKVTEVIGLTVEVKGFSASIGELCLIGQGAQAIEAEVVGFSGDRLLLFPYRSLQGIAPGSVVQPLRQKLMVHCGEHLLGQVLDGLGRPLEGGQFISMGQPYPLDQSPPNPLIRTRIDSILETGVKAIDLFLTAGNGQRLGIFAGSGVGKSTLLGMIARGSTADCNVIALVGERGREVRDFLEKDLGPDGLKRSVVVVATSDQSALLRIKSALTATAIAEYFRDQGKNVMLLMDSVTRFAMSQREIGLAIGEPPTTRGYPPSVFAMLPRLLERSGTGERGAITALYTVLVEGDDMNEPVADTVRGILDGHIVLSRKLAERNQYPSIDVLHSVSRLAADLAGREHASIISYCRSLLAIFRQNEDLITIGAYVKGSSVEIDEAIDKAPRIMSVLGQGVEECYPLETALTQLKNAVAR